MTTLGVVSCLLAALGVAGIIWSIWSLYCNERTYQQRTVLINFLFARQDWSQLQAEFSRVTYADHVRALMHLRDPADLYNSPLSEVLRRPA